MWARIGDIPVKLLINNIISLCEARDILSLGCTNRFFALHTTNDIIWKQKLVVDYNFTVSKTARMSGWKFIYQRLKNSRIFVWGCVIFSFDYAMRCSLDCNHSGGGTMANLGCHGFQRQPSQMFLSQLNCTFQVFVWSAWQQVKCQCTFCSYSQQTPLYLIVSVC